MIVERKQKVSAQIKQLRKRLEKLLNPVLFRESLWWCDTLASSRGLSPWTGVLGVSRLGNGGGLVGSDLGTKFWLLIFWEGGRAKFLR